MEGPLHIKIRGLYKIVQLSTQSGYNLEALSSVGLNQVFEIGRETTMEATPEHGLSVVGRPKMEG